MSSKAVEWEQEYICRLQVEWIITGHKAPRVGDNSFVTVCMCVRGCVRVGLCVFELFGVSTYCQVGTLIVTELGNKLKCYH